MVAAVVWGAPKTPSTSDVLPLGTGLRVRLVQGRELTLELDDTAGYDAYELTEDGYHRVAFAKLRPEHRALVLRAAFPNDRADGDDWLHVARKSPLPIFDEGLWQVAAWFTGDGSHFEELQRVNALNSPELSAGQLVRIPAGLLDVALRVEPTSEEGALAYGTDARGPFAGYRLKPGEALYSAVVLRFTGRTAPDDVEALARTIAARSDIRRLTDIPAGRLVKIPLDVLEPEFLPKSDERRKSIENAKAAMERELLARPPTRTKQGLDGVVVIIDPGHGGMDPGAMNHSVWEHDYVFDVAVRLRRELETKYGASVVLTLDDPSADSTPSRGDLLEMNRKRSVLATPAFLADDDGETSIAVNLRWYVANSIYRRLVKKGTNPDKIVFLSLHADARHPSLRGAMVYVPGAGYRAGTMGYSSSSYLRFKEVREQPRVSYTSRERLRSEAVSRRFAAAIVRAMKERDLPVQPYQPIRERVIRGQKEWLPAVLRGNAVPTKVLVEMVNLNNPDDAALLGHATDRERLAKALALALTEHFGPARKRSRS